MKKNNIMKKWNIFVIIILIMNISICAVQSSVIANAKCNESCVSDVEKNKVIPLYNTDNEIVAYYVDIKNGGYVITDSAGNDFIEYSLEDDGIQLDEKSTYFYCAPCSLYRETEDEEVVDCYAGNAQNTRSISDLECEIEPVDSANNVCGSEKRAVSLASDLALQLAEKVTVKEEKKLSYSTQKYDYNPDGRCGSVAGAILLRYYDKYYDGGYVASSYETADGKKLINYLTNNFLGTNTTYSQLKSGLNDYLEKRGYSRSFKLLKGLNSTSVYSKIKTYIKGNKPLIVGLTQHPKYGEHWVVGTGYSIVYSDSYGYGYVVIVNDGWGNENIRINNQYVDGVVYKN